MPLEPLAAPRSVPEPLAESAPLARQWASRLCTGQDADCSCGHYHCFWQYLRLMGLGSTLGGHPQDYLASLAQLGRQWAAGPGAAGVRRRVLVSGSADYSMLAHVAAALSPWLERVSLHVLDLCPTPLELNRWYAQHAGLKVETICADVLSHACDEGYDLIVTSSLLGYFSPPQRPALFQRYFSLLRGGGRLMFSNRLRPEAKTAAAGFDSSQAAGFVRTVEDRLDRLPALARLDPDEARQMAQAYARRRAPHPVRSFQEIADLAESAGLQVESSHSVSSASTTSGVRGPTLGDGSQFAFVVLRRLA